MEFSALEVPRRSISSPEFEFWMVGNNPSDPQPGLLTADELFVDGVLLPLRLLSLPPHNPEPEMDATTEPDPPPPIPSASICCTAAPPSASKRWKDIFKVGDKKMDRTNKEKKKDRKSSADGAAELNINIWPFSRSRSAGNRGVRPRPSSASASRKTSSAPCSRSNSRGESSKSVGSVRRCAASPSRNSLSGGVHLGRASPVWQLRRQEKAAQKVNSFGRKPASRVLSLNVNTCIGYRNHVSCRSDDGEEAEAAAAAAGGGGSGGLFNLRTLFTKKVY